MLNKWNKWRAKNALCKAYKLYNEKKMQYLKVDTIDLYQQFEDVQYAIAYVLHEYFDFKCDNPFSYKWYITNDYTRYYNECKKAYEKLTKQNNKEKDTAITYLDIDGVYRFTDVKSLNNAKFKLAKGSIVFCYETSCLYLWDGICFKNLC